MTDKH